MGRLRAGSMGSAASSGVPPQFAGSLAAAIEDAYWAALGADSKDQFDRTTNAESDRDRRRIFVAIAQGVVGYLDVNSDAFKVVGPSTVVSGVSIDIETTP